MIHNYIDLHCHTIASKYKTGESEKRNVPNKECFLNAMRKKQVSVVAITNHNYFDSKQFEDFKDNEDVVVFPGIELDIVLFNGNIGHLLLISNPKDDKYNSFLDFIQKIKADNIDEACFIKIKLQDFPDLINDLDCLIVVHYGGKASSFLSEDLDFLKIHCCQSVFVEPSSLISAFIYLNKGMQSILGSDIKDWSNYPGKELPELKMPISDFSKLKLLLKKDKSIIKENLKPKIFDASFPISIYNDKFEIDEKIEIYKDCNVIMGPKSSGKSIFLKAIKDQLITRGYASKVKCYFAEEVSELYKKISEYSPSDEDINSFADTGNLFKEEISEIKRFSFPKIENVFQKIDEFNKVSSRTKLAKQLGFVSCFTSFQDDSFAYSKNKSKYKADFLSIANFRKKEQYKEYLDSRNVSVLNSLLEKAKKRVIDDFNFEFISHESLLLARKCILDFKNIFTQLKATAAMPTTTGLLELFEKEKEFISNAAKLRGILEKEKKQTSIPVGYLDGKGKVCFVKEISSALTYSRSKNPISLLKTGFSTNVKTIYGSLNLICNDTFGENFTDEILKTSKLIGEYNVTSIKDFLGYQSYFVRQNGNKFIPSKGEQAILVLSDCLNDNNASTEFYLLDEPEMSVGHHYVNSTIVPRIKELCSLNKCVIVCTHDANIGVGTLPFQVIYREEDLKGTYHTFQGNPFNDSLMDQFGNGISWKDTAINVLEGGREALDLREVTYGDRD